MGTFYRDAQETVFSDLDLVGAETLHRALTSEVRSPDAPALVAYGTVSPSTSGEALLDLAPLEKSPVSVVDQVVAVGYFVVPAGATVQLRLYEGELERASVSPGTTGWSSATWVSGDLTQNQLNDLRAQVDLAAGADPPEVHALYLEIQTTETSLTFVPPSTSATGVGPTPFRPHLHPGSFWM